MISPVSVYDTRGSENLEPRCTVSESEIVARQPCEVGLLILAFQISEEFIPHADEASLAAASGRGQYFRPDDRSVPCGTLPLVVVWAVAAHPGSVHAGLCGESEDWLGRL